jgi:hypothetical protein
MAGFEQDCRVVANCLVNMSMVSMIKILKAFQSILRIFFFHGTSKVALEEGVGDNKRVA